MEYKKIVKLVTEILQDYKEATVRQLYYRIISDPYCYFDNTKNNYVSFVRYLTKAREQGDIDWRKIIDSTRTIIWENNFYNGVTDFLQRMEYSIHNQYCYYNIDLWKNQIYFPLVCVEKDALARIISEAVAEYQVPVIPGRGFNSFSQIMELLDLISTRNNKHIKILYFGDFDPSGIEIAESLKNRIESYSTNINKRIKFIRCALNVNDVINLTPNKIKKGDRRSKKYKEKYNTENCYELDALPPDELRKRVIDEVEKLINMNIWNRDNHNRLFDRNRIKEKLENIKIA
jgi:DNA topoisomerase VI subunit A